MLRAGSRSRLFAKLELRRRSSDETPRAVGFDLTDSEENRRESFIDEDREPLLLLAFRRWSSACSCWISPLNVSLSIAVEEAVLRCLATRVWEGIS